MLRPGRLLVLLGLLSCGPGGGRDACAVDGECPLHQYCDAASARCVSGCLAGSDCPGGVCDGHGRCAAAGPPGPDGSDGSDGAVGGSDLAATPGADLAGASGDLAAAPDLAPVDAAGCLAACPTAGEPNDTPGQATAISDAVTLSAPALCPAGDVDWYALTASHRGSLDVYLTNGPCGVPLRVDVIGSDGVTPMGTSASTTPGWHAGAPVRPGDVRYLRVQPLTVGAQNAYTLQVTNN